MDILAHPGLIAEEDVLLAREKGVLLEISARKGHSLTNGHVARLAKQIGANLIYSTDTHAPGDLLTEEMAQKVVRGAGLSLEDFSVMQRNAYELAKKVMGAR